MHTSALAHPFSLDVVACPRSTIADLMSLRRFRKQAEGLDLEKLNRGEVKKRKKKQQQQQAADGSGEGAPPAGEDEDDEDEEGGDEVTVGGLKQGRGEQSVHISHASICDRASVPGALGRPPSCARLSRVRARWMRRS